MTSLKNTGGALIAGVVSRVKDWEALSTQAELPCDIVELRVDALPEAQRRIALSVRCPKPLLVTLRHADEGGQCEWSEEERQSLAKELLPVASAVDWEVAHLEGAEGLLAEAKERGVAIVASAHFFHGMPTLAKMVELELRARRAGADVIKIAFTPGSEDDVQLGLDFLRRERGEMRAAVMGMGPLAARSRALYARHGSVLLYGYLGATPTAPGQLSAAQCRGLLE